MRSALVIMEPWDAHWCPVFTARQDHQMQFLNTFARQLFSQGWPVFVMCADIDLGPYPQAVEAREHESDFVPLEGPTREVYHDPHWTATGDACAHAPPLHEAGRVWQTVHKDLRLDGYLLMQTFQSLYSNARRLGVDRLVYCGATIDCCVMCRPYGMSEMLKHGFDVALLPDLTTCHAETRRAETLALCEKMGIELLTLHVETMRLSAGGFEDPFDIIRDR